MVSFHYNLLFYCNIYALPKSADETVEESPSLQPPTYPSLKPLSQLSDTSIQLQSPEEDYMLTNIATTKTLPKGE